MDLFDLILVSYRKTRLSATVVLKSMKEADKLHSYLISIIRPNNKVYVIFLSSIQHSFCFIEVFTHFGTLERLV